MPNSVPSEQHPDQIPPIILARIRLILQIIKPSLRRQIKLIVVKNLHDLVVLRIARENHLVHLGEVGHDLVKSAVKMLRHVQTTLANSQTNLLLQIRHQTIQKVAGNHPWLLLAAARMSLLIGELRQISTKMIKKDFGKFPQCLILAKFFSIHIVTYGLVGN